jgi:hypothetical protein
MWFLIPLHIIIAYHSGFAMVITTAFTGRYLRDKGL